MRLTRVASPRRWLLLLLHYDEGDKDYVGVLVCLLFNRRKLLFFIQVYKYVWLASRSNLQENKTA